MNYQLCNLEVEKTIAIFKYWASSRLRNLEQAQYWEGQIYGYSKVRFDNKWDNIKYLTMSYKENTACKSIIQSGCGGEAFKARPDLQ